MFSIVVTFGAERSFPFVVDSSAASWASRTACDPPMIRPMEGAAIAVGKFTARLLLVSPMPPGRLVTPVTLEFVPIIAPNG